MAQGHGAAVDVRFLGIESQLLDHCQGLDRKSFVQLDQIDVLKLPPYLFE